MGLQHPVGRVVGMASPELGNSSVNGHGLSTQPILGKVRMNSDLLTPSLKTGASPV